MPLFVPSEEELAEEPPREPHHSEEPSGVLQLLAQQLSEFPPRGYAGELHRGRPCAHLRTQPPLSNTDLVSVDDDRWPRPLRGRLGHQGRHYGPMAGPR